MQLQTLFDEYSRFSFAYPVKDICTATVIKWFFIYIRKLKTWLFSKGIASSRTTPCNPINLIGIMA